MLMTVEPTKHIKNNSNSRGFERVLVFTFSSGKHKSPENLFLVQQLQDPCSNGEFYLVHVNEKLLFQITKKGEIEHLFDSYVRKLLTYMGWSQLEEQPLGNSAFLAINGDLNVDPSRVSLALLELHWAKGSQKLEDYPLVSNWQSINSTQNEKENLSGRSYRTVFQGPSMVLASISLSVLSRAISDIFISNTIWPTIFSIEVPAIPSLTTTLQRLKQTPSRSACGCSSDRVELQYPSEIPKGSLVLENFKNMLEAQIPFAFNRFSDGEIMILQNQYLELGITGSQGWRLGNKIHTTGHYPDEERKRFDPLVDFEFRDALVRAYKFDKMEYYVGVTPPCCLTEHGLGDDPWKLQLDLYGKRDPHYMVSANALANGNYSSFLSEIVPTFALYNVLTVFNKRSRLDRLPFYVTRAISAEDNCLSDWRSLVKEVTEAIDEILRQRIKAKPLLVLTSCGPAAKVIIHNVYAKYSDITCIDIGSALNPLLRLEGWVHTRGYLREYWHFHRRFYLEQTCTLPSEIL